MPRTSSFNVQYQFSEQESEKVTAILLQRFYGAVKVIRADPQADKAGTDWIVIRTGLPPVNVDVKRRESDWSVPGPGNDWHGGPDKDDVALETWSDIELKKPGWTRDPTKTSDYIMWFWVDTERFYFVPFQPLCSIFTEHWEDWKEIYKTRQQPSENWTAWMGECTFVPRRILERELFTWFKREAICFSAASISV